MSQCYAIGIDLGTTYSCVGVPKRQIEIAQSDNGPRLTPSEVYYSSEEVLVGEGAQNKSREHPENTIYQVKRFMGQNYKDVDEDIQNYPFCIENHDGKPVFDVEMGGRRKKLTPVEVSAEILKKMKEAAMKLLDHTVTDAVITVPAYFNNAQRKATKEAACLAGLNVLRIINEPTAAAMAFVYQNENTTKEDRTVLMFDLGGGTFDVSIVKVTKGSIFEVKATGGDTHLGGADFNERLRDHCVKEIGKKIPEKEIRKNRKAMKRLLNDCEKLKQELSTNNESKIYFNSFSDESFNICVTRAVFENLCEDLFEKTITTLDQVLIDAKLKKSDIDDVVLVGGSTRIPKIRKMLKEFFGGKELKESVDADQAVAYGATVQAIVLSGATGTPYSEIELRDVTPLSLGVKVGKYETMSVVIKRNTPIPTESKHVYTCYKYQKKMEIEVFEGERPKSKDNHRLGEIVLSDFTPELMIDVKLEVTFSIDADGILTVSAIEKTTGKNASVTIEDRLSKSEIKENIRKAEEHRLEDGKELARIKALENFQNFLNEIQRVSMNDTKVSNFKKRKTDRWLEAGKNWIESNRDATKEMIEKEHENRKAEYNKM